VEETLQRFGADYHRRGFPDEAYESLGHSLLRSARASLEAGWSSELSSGWVAHYLWLHAHVLVGVESAGAEERQTVDPGRAAGGSDPLGAVHSLNEILERLRSTYFRENEAALGPICTRVMLRTGANLRAPRAEHMSDPAVIAHVLESLMLMGYTIALPSPGAPTGLVPGHRPAQTHSPAQTYGPERTFSTEQTYSPERNFSPEQPAPPPRRWAFLRRHKDPRPRATHAGSTSSTREQG
jgi:hypothetical protein